MVYPDEFKYKFRSLTYRVSEGARKYSDNNDILGVEMGQQVTVQGALDCSELGRQRGVR